MMEQLYSMYNAHFSILLPQKKPKPKPWMLLRLWTGLRACCPLDLGRFGSSGRVKRGSRCSGDRWVGRIFQTELNPFPPALLLTLTGGTDWPQSLHTDVEHLIDPSRLFTYLSCDLTSVPWKWTNRGLGMLNREESIDKNNSMSAITGFTRNTGRPSIPALPLVVVTPQPFPGFISAMPEAGEEGSSKKKGSTAGVRGISPTLAQL